MATLAPSKQSTSAHVAGSASALRPMQLLRRMKGASPLNFQAFECEKLFPGLPPQVTDQFEFSVQLDIPL